MGVSGIDFVIFLNLGAVHVVGALVVYHYWDRIDGSRGRDRSPPSDADEWRAAVREGVADVSDVLDDADPPVDEDLRRALVPPTSRLRRLARTHPERLDDGLVERLHALETACRDVSMRRLGRTPFDPGVDVIAELDGHCESVRRRLEVADSDGE